MTLPYDEIHVEDLEVFAHHGVFPEENRLGQKFVISLVLYADTRPAGTADRLEQSVHYGEVSAFLTDYMHQNTFQLIETAAEHMAEEVLLHYPLVKGLTLELKKPWAPVGLPLKTVSVKITRFGPAVQLGNTGDGGEKPRFASLRADQSLQTITLEEALALFELPRTLGKFEDEDVVASIGRFGPYVRHAGKFVSIPKGLTAETITLEEAQQLIIDSRNSAAQRVIATVPEEPELQVLNGRFGPYISYKKANYKIPKGKDAKELTLADCREIVADEANASKASVRRAAAKKTTRRAATKKAAAK